MSRLASKTLISLSNPGGAVDPRAWAGASRAGVFRDAPVGFE
jgi:hypothetical protein